MPRPLKPPAAPRTEAPLVIFPVLRRFQLPIPSVVGRHRVVCSPRGVTFPNHDRTALAGFEVLGQ